ncbi:MAG: carboxypeptidase-like regulatory domain-containing protein [Flavobacteriaceae bacterium]
MKKHIIFLFILFGFYGFSQEKIKGKVYENTEDNKNLPLIGATVMWEGTTEGTQTDIDGNFELTYKKDQNLVVSFIGMRTDTLAVTENKFQEITLYPDSMLETIVIERKRQSLSRLRTSSANITNISSSELLKAACCNLSEAFETNPSIDVNFSDAITGNKQIRMLGLNSPYILMAEENIPTARGASQAYGLSFIPGTWVESIQITKGAGSVTNGYESISGQINYELIKPINDIPMFVNAYASTDSRFELNTHFNKKISDKWSSSLFIHGNARTGENDMNHDHFLDNPLGKQINVMNRWQFTDAEKGWVSFMNFRYMNDEKQSGSVHFDKDRDKLTTNYWGSEILTEKFDASAKVGYVFPDTPWKSFGFQNSFNAHKQDSYFGLTQYNIHQNSFYSNLLYNSILSNTMHKFSTGISFTYDQYDEMVATTDWGRTDNSVGTFFEYTYDNTDDFSLVAGVRLDNHNRLGTFVTPRIHSRYNPWKGGTLKASAGRGIRSANIFAENQHLFASSRVFDIVNAGGKIYGLDPEIAWNYGLSFMQDFLLFGKKTEVIADFYRTDFENQVVVDLYASPQQVLFYNLDGSSFANSFQLELNYEITHHFNIRTAYKYYDIQTDYTGGRDIKPLQAKHRFFTNVAYETHVSDKGKQWKFDWTMNLIGKQKLPFTGSNPVHYQAREWSPSLTLMNAQVTHSFSPVFEVYVGGENITNYRQQDAIIGAHDAFGTYFDSSMIYGPVFGAMYYAGLRFKIE